MTENKPRGKFFTLCSPITDLVLEVKDATDRPYADVTVGEPISELDTNNDHQLWYFDLLTSTIRSKLNSFCLDLLDGYVVVSPYLRGNTCQQWTYNKGKVQQLQDSTVLMVVENYTREPGARITTDEDLTDLKQAWKLDHRPAQYFYIRSQEDDSKVMDVKGGTKSPGTKVIIWADQGNKADNQLWYEDENGVIRSKIKGFALDSETKSIVVMPYSIDNPHQQYIVWGDTIQHRHKKNEVIAIKHASGLRKGEDCLMVSDYVGTPDQLWTFQFVPDQGASLNHSGIGREYAIRNRRSGLYLEVREGSYDIGAEVVTSYRRKGVRWQNFYSDEHTGTIRTALDDFALSLEDNTLVVKPFDPYDKTQQWRFAERRIKNRYKINTVLQVNEGSKEPGAKVVGADLKDDDNQTWEVIHVPARTFLLINVNSQLAMDVKDVNESSGADVITWRPHPVAAANQLWYEDEKGILRCKLNGYMLDTSNKGAKLATRPYDPTNRKQAWVLMGNIIQNKYEKKIVLDVEHQSKKSGGRIHEWKYHGQNSQKWRVVHAEIGERVTFEL